MLIVVYLVHSYASVSLHEYPVTKVLLASLNGDTGIGIDPPSNIQCGEVMLLITVPANCTAD